MKWPWGEPWTRRQFLGRTALLPSLSYLQSIEAKAAETPSQRIRRPPYAALEKFIDPGADEFPGEKAAFELRDTLRHAFQSRQLPLAPAAGGFSPCPIRYASVAADLDTAVFEQTDRNIGNGWRNWIESVGDVQRAEFYVLPENVVRYEVASKTSVGLCYRIGNWRVHWHDGQITSFEPVAEQVAKAQQPWFGDVSAHAFQSAPEAAEQLRRGVPYWRASLDPASGVDLYGSNGISVGDIDNDGLDEIYVCQGGGLPNRLLKMGDDGRLSDLTDKWGAGLLDDTSCALFLDTRNIGRQDLVVLRSSGPLLFLNEGDRFRLRTDAFVFAEIPRGGFTGMAAADFDCDGKLDLYLCCYVYFQSEAQYTYAAPYHDAQNGPPNFLFRNRLKADGSGAFEDCTSETGINENNNRFSFAPAWCDYNGDGWPDLYVANDFGRKNLYQNHQGSFRDVAAQAGVEDVGPGMSAAWFDFDGDGRPDLYVANMWTDAGQRIVADPAFKPALREADAYHAHTMGNSLFRNRGDGAFADVTKQQDVGFGRWAWSSGGHDLDHDGTPEILVTCGMLTNKSDKDLGSFFWRQVVARSPLQARPSEAYENGWNAINQFAREDLSWNGHEPNVVHARRGDRFYDFSGVSGFDFANDSRAFAVTDFDDDGCPDILLKSRLGPQLQILQNGVAGKHEAIAFRLHGTKSNRDAIGARIEVDGQTKWLEAGSGFLSQHSKRMLFGLGPDHKMAAKVRIIWPSGLCQELTNLHCGRTYIVSEGEANFASEPFRPRRALPRRSLAGDNELELSDTWFLDGIPLPVPAKGPGLFVVRELTPEFEILRRYLFDYRAPLQVPLALLLNREGEAVKVYGAMPSPAAVQSDLTVLENKTVKALPYRGFYVKQPARDYFKFGAAYLWAGLPQQALPYLQRVLTATPDNARVLTLIGQIHLENHHPELAAEEFKKAIQLAPDSAHAWIGMGDVAAQADRQTEAADAYRKAISLDPHSAEAANALGLTCAKLQQWAEAQSLFERAIELRRDYADAINNLGVLFMQTGKISQAIAAWSYGVKAAPDAEILYLNLGRAYVSSNQPDKARLVMQQLLDRDGSNETARRALAELGSK